MVEHKVVDDPSMQWYWNDKDGSLSNGADKKFHLENDFGWGMMADSSAKGASEWFPKTKRKWFYEDTRSEITTEIDGVESSLSTLG